MQARYDQHRMVDANGVTYIDHNLHAPEMAPSAAAAYTRATSVARRPEDDFTGVFDGAMQAIQAATDSIATYTGAFALYAHLRESWFHKLYRTNVRDSTMAAIGLHDDLDGMLSTFAENLESNEVLLRLVELTMGHAAVLLERVLLDGGPHRNFVVDDVRVMEADKDRLK